MPTTLERAYRVRLRPTRAQERMLRRLMGAKRYVWNWALAQSNTAYRETGKRMALKDLSSALTALRKAPETAWLSGLPREPFDQVLRDLEQAFGNAFAKRAGFPVFKRRGKVSAVRFTLNQRREQVDREAGRVQIDRVGKVRFRVTEPLVGRLRSVTVSLDSAGRWFASFTADGVPRPEAKSPRFPALGIDMGLKDAVVLSTGARAAAPKPLKAKLAKLRRYQRSYARQRDHQLQLLGLDPAKPIPKGTRLPVSNRAKKTAARIGSLHAQVADQRRAFQHQLSRHIVDAAAVIALEDLNLVAMGRSMGRRAFHRSVADVGLGELRRQIEYKAAWAGRIVLRVDRFFPSSKTCGACDHVHAGLTLSDRRWACPACGAQHDRDINAAKNIEREGLRLLAGSATPRSGGSHARGESTATATTPKHRARRTVNSSTAGIAGSPRSAGMEPARQGEG
ncbi:MAG: transposase [Rhizobiaceae bacterium]|nr:transposase [Rhizobiaceae bacterium]